MKKVLLTATLVAIFAFTSNAQEAGDMNISAGVGITTGSFEEDDSYTGFGGGFEYVFADAMSGTVEYYSYTDDSFTIGVLGIDFKYYFLTSDFRAFGKVGFSNVNPDDEDNDSDSAAGINLGVGGIYGITDSLGINAGLDYNLAQGVLKIHSD